MSWFSTFQQWNGKGEGVTVVWQEQIMTVVPTTLSWIVDNPTISYQFCNLRCPVWEEPQTSLGQVHQLFAMLLICIPCNHLTINRTTTKMRKLIIQSTFIQDRDLKPSYHIKLHINLWCKNEGKNFKNFKLSFNQPLLGSITRHSTAISTRCTQQGFLLT